MIIAVNIQWNKQNSSPKTPGLSLPMIIGFGGGGGGGIGGGGGVGGGGCEGVKGPLTPP